MNIVTWKHRGALRLAALPAALALGAVTIAGCNNTAGGTSVSSAPLATVGAEQVTRQEFYSTLEAAHGNDALVQLVDYHLLMQKAQAENVTITDDEVTQALAERQAREPQLSSVVAAGGPRLEALQREIRLQLAAQKLLTQPIKVTDAELTKFFNKYAKQWYDQPAKVKIGALFSTTKTRADLMASQLAKKTKTFEQLVNEQKKAQDPAAALSNLEAPTADSITNFPPDIRPKLLTMPIGSTTAPQQVRLSPTVQTFAIFRVVQRVPAKKADLKTLRSTVELDYKLSKVAEETVKQNPNNPPFDQALINTANAYFGPQSGNANPRLRDVLTYITQFATNQAIGRLRSSGQVTIEDTNYAPLAELYKSGAPGAPGSANPASSVPGAGGAPMGAAPAAPK